MSWTSAFPAFSAVGSENSAFAGSDKICELYSSDDDAYCYKLWFKSEPVDRSFCYRVAQLQLVTDSHDQGWISEESVYLGSWSWFEVVILADANATEPRFKGKRELKWRSHNNRIGVPDKSRHFGIVFDRRGELLDDLEVGNVIGVRLCTRFPGWSNHAYEGRIDVKLLNEDLFSPQSWTLASPATPGFSPEIKNGVYTLLPTTECNVIANDDAMASRIWFTTPVLDEYVIQRIEELQLYTYSYGVGVNVDPKKDFWSWFDVMILDSPEATSPKIVDGLSLVWSSHQNKPEDEDNTNYQGYVFGRDDPLLRFLEVGNVIAVRVCAKFAGWANHARDGQLVVRIANGGEREPPPPYQLEDAKENTLRLQAAIKENYNETRPGINVQSQMTALLSDELRADENHGDPDQRPLRLLSLDGGGVRGISSLHILKEIMLKVSNGDASAKPCDYFDMIAGTSTGGLIAIMLGRLQMTVDECIKSYNELAKVVFTSENHEGTIARYDGKVLADCIKKIVNQRTQNSDATMLDEQGKCKVFVVAVRSESVNNEAPVHIRTFTNKKMPTHYSNTNWKIWQAGRATSAAPTYFDQMVVDGYNYTDGGLGANNPILELLAEVSSVYGPLRPIGCLLSIGTGIAPNVSLGDPTDGPIRGILHIGQAVAALATNCERTRDTFESASLPYLPKQGEEKYWRFNVAISTKDTKPGIPNYESIIELDDYKNMDAFVEKTKEYLKGQTLAVEQCAAKLQGKIN
ncbi:hypothetical protein BOTBODRAFT_219380 [Botryobasidium botryosum FD-172 SS1]|uniref:PNPLA domain-containing protein n=1 Tax=Botryobasidium botryosum (strain FD-172 SS1) TaxID=930990 RepID=A0A067MZH2_BOTB1|nr:hypothetical protein BOTBODRAFT_219380 [Botryobasidium botryosum FD-172 SS1]